VWLESNNIISIDRNAFVGLNNLEKVCLKDNPIRIMFPTNIRRTYICHMLTQTSNSVIIRKKIKNYNFRKFFLKK